MLLLDVASNELSKGLMKNYTYVHVKEHTN